MGIFFLASCQQKTKPDAPPTVGQDGGLSLTVNQDGEITLSGKKIEIENLQKNLVEALEKMPAVPDGIDIKYEGEVLMGMRGEVETEVADAIAAAKAAKGRPVVEIQRFRKQKGTDCDRADGEPTNCAIIDFQYPAVKSGTSALREAVDKWTADYLTGILTGGAAEKNAPAATLGDASKVFFDSHEEYKGSAMYGAFEAGSGSDIVLNDGKYLSLAINGHTFQGGAHGSNTSAFATFDARSGKRLTWDDVTTDKAALKKLAERKFRKERAEVFKDGFEFDETFPFKLPGNFALVQSGIYLHYDPYEVGPYAIGPTTFVLPFSEMGGLLKINPLSRRTGSAATSGIYKMEGNEVVIPAFEIEVGHSPKAKKVLGDRKETTLVIAYFSGLPTNEEDSNETGMMHILEKEIELTGNDNIARFAGLKFSKKMYGKLADKDIEVLINVVSGRKSSEDNLLDCGLVEKKVSELSGKRFKLECRLIQ